MPDDQAEVVFSDVFVEQLEELTDVEKERVLVEVVGLCEAPGGKHPLSKELTGWNTVDVLGGDKRVVYKASVRDGVGLVEVLCLGPRADSEVYVMAAALVESGLLAGDEAIQIWQALTLLEVVEEAVGIDGWDYRPSAAAEGFVRSVVAAGLLDENLASLLSTDELAAAMRDGWGPDGPDPAAALAAAMARARGRSDYPGAAVVLKRSEDRCGARMPRAGVACIRVAGHPGPHRST